MTEQATQAQTGSYRSPRIEHARVADAMRHGVLTCAIDASLRAAARTMTLHHIHTVVVSGAEDGALAGIVSDGQLVDALLQSGASERTLGEIAQQALTLSSDRPLADALAAMRAAGVDHAIVLDARSGRPIGMLSTLDALGLFAWGEV